MTNWHGTNPSPEKIISSMGNNVDTFLAAAMGGETLVNHDRRNRNVVRPPRGTPRLLLVPLLILPSCMVLLFVVMLCRSFLDDLSQPLLEHIAQERSLCSRGQSRQWCCGHRGARTLAPENTMASFLTSLQVGANCIEMDLHRTGTGELAVIHSGHYRTKVLPANNRRDIAANRIEDTPWVTLQSLDAGGWFSKKFRNEQIPSFNSVLETFWDVDVRLIVELKAEECPFNSLQCQAELKWEELYAHSVEEALVKVQYERGGGLPRFSMIFTSFNHSLVNQLVVMLESLSSSQPRTGKLISGLGYILDPHLNYTRRNFQHQVTWLAPHVSKTAEVQKLWRGSRCLSSWVTDSQVDLEEQFRLGAQAVTTNLPALCPSIKMDT